MTNPEFCDSLTTDVSPALQEWLRRITKGLGRIGITRVVDEIGSWYREALENTRSYDGAMQKVMAMISDPGESRKSYRNKYMTQRQEKSLVPFHVYHPKRMSRRALLFWICVLFYPLFILHQHPEFGLSGTVGYLLLMAFGIHIRLQDFVTKGKVRKMLRLITLGFLAMWVWMVIFCLPELPFIFGAGSVLVFWLILRNHALIKKVPEQLTEEEIGLILADVDLRETETLTV